MNDTGNIVRAFYNQTPFPDYDLGRFNDKEDLIAHAQSFAKILDRSIPKDASVIDVGTGTGQLSAFLSLKRENVYGLDFSDKSIGKAKSLKEKLHLDSLNLRKMNILDTDQIRSINMKFDYVLCLGVLHHTGDAYKGFKNILELVKPGGYVAVGLYNKLGRIPLKIRIMLVKTIFKDNKKIKKKFLEMQLGEVNDEEKIRGWWNDQYLHPHETVHTVGEVLRWFKKNDITYLESVPSLKLFDERIFEITGVFNKSDSYPNFFIRVIKQLWWIFKTNREGGYWIMFGQKGNE